VHSAEMQIEAGITSNLPQMILRVVKRKAWNLLPDDLAVDWLWTIFGDTCNVITTVM